MEDKMEELRKIVYETRGAGIALRTHEQHGWSLTLTKHGDTYIGTLQEVLQCAIDEFTSYRVPIINGKYSKKDYKKYEYK